MRYRIHRIKDSPQESFRWSAHTGGAAVLKLRDYEVSEEIEAATPYQAWRQLSSGSRPIRPGDVLEAFVNQDDSGPLYVAKYIGFEPAQWFVPAPRVEATSSVEQVAGVTSEQA